MAGLQDVAKRGEAIERVKRLPVTVLPRTDSTRSASNETRFSIPAPDPAGTALRYTRTNLDVREIAHRVY